MTSTNNKFGEIKMNAINYLKSETLLILVSMIGWAEVIYLLPQPV
jgi:hypothetical protein